VIVYSKHIHVDFLQTVMFLTIYFSMTADLYPSTCRDWIDPDSILDVICVMHADIGEATSRLSHTQTTSARLSIFLQRLVSP
jgi:hypothetical protein